MTIRQQAPGQTLARCDVVLTRDHRVYINGTLIGNVVNFSTDQQQWGRTTISLEMEPTSLIFGDVPNATVEALAADQSDDVPSVDINRAIARAQARSHGLDPDQHVRPAPTPTAAPVPARKASIKREADPIPLSADPDDDEQVQCYASAKGGPCTKAYGHTGIHVH